MDPLIGQHLGQYQILAKLGAGGMATVYRARQISVDRDVAIKIIRPDLIEEVGFAERFQREARTIASLSHLHILKVFDFGQENNLAYLVMELLEGGSLSRLLREQGPLLPTQAARMLDQIGQALDYAHEHGVIHRDLKPDNVLLDKAQNCFLMDFGIAKLINETTRITRTGLAMGTPAYMAPELWAGQSADALTDIYALGVMLYEMLVGKSPFLADTPFRIMHMHIYEPLPLARSKNPTLPEGTDEVISKALSKNRDQRFMSAGKLAAAFQAVANGTIPTDLLAPQPTRATASMTAAAPAAVVPGYVPTPTPRRPAPLLAEEPETPPRRQSGMLVLSIVGLLIVIAVLAVAALSLLNDNNTRQTQTAAAGLLQTQGVLQQLQQTFDALTAVAILPAVSPSPVTLVQVISTATPSLISTEIPTAPPTLSATITLTETPTATSSETPTSTSTPTNTPTFTPTLDLEALVAATLGVEQTETAMAVRIEQTVNAFFLANQATNNAVMTTQAQQTQVALATLTAEAEQTQAALATLTAEAQQTQAALLATLTAEAQQTQVALTIAAEATNNALQLIGTLNAGRTAAAASQKTAAAIQTLTAYASPTAPEGSCPNFLPSRLVIGEYARITPGDPNRLRTAPNSSNVIATVPGGSAVKVLDGPTCTISGDSDGLAWWKVDWQGYQGWTAEGKGSVYWIEPLGPTLPATYVVKRTPPPADQRRAAPPGSTILGDFQVEWYCTDRGYGVILVNSQSDWACTNKPKNTVAFVLKAADFDAICRSWYSDTNAFAIQDMTKSIDAYNWRCYTFR